MTANIVMFAFDRLVIVTSVTKKNNTLHLKLFKYTCMLFCTIFLIDQEQEFTWAAFTDTDLTLVLA